MTITLKATQIIFLGLVATGCEATLELTTVYTARITNNTSSEVTIPVETCDSCKDNASCTFTPVTIAPEQTAETLLVQCTGNITSADGSSFGPIPKKREYIFVLPNIPKETLDTKAICRHPQSVPGKVSEPASEKSLTIEESGCPSETKRMSEPARDFFYPGKNG